MPSIDERVVEMKFRRDDFLKGTEQTLGALNRLESALTGSNGIAAGLQNIQNKFSAAGVFGMGALLALGGAAVNTGMKIASNIMEPIFGGGKRRALNLEQANFQLMGILKDSDKVAAVMKDVNYAVDGTAYGLDAAAIAAAQFAASGMEAGKEMADALRGISGVAAMSGSSYEDVSSIFTKVAGQGRLMGDDLNRLATRGINAAATLAEYFEKTGKQAGLTEADIRTMVTKGKISFEDFSDAMNLAFGDHATKANETYAGSLSNIQAALARVGAPAFAIEHEKMRRIFNALRPVVNAFQKSLGPVYETYKRLYAIPMAEMFERWGKSMESFDFGPMATTLSQVLVIGSTLRDVIGSWIAPIRDAFGIIFAQAPGGSWMATVRDFLNGFNRGLGGLAATEEQAARVRDTFVRVFDVLRNFGSFVGGVFEAAGPVVQWFWDILMRGLDLAKAGFEWLKPYIMDAFEYLFGLESPLRAFWDQFRSDVEKSGSVFTTLGERARAMYEKYITPAIESLQNFRDVIMDVKDNGFKGLKEKIKDAFAPLEDVWKWIGSVKDRLVNFFTAVQNPLDGIKAEFPSVGEWIKTLLTWINEGFKDAGPVVQEVFGHLRDFFVNLSQVLGDFFSDVSIEDLDRIRVILGQIVMGILLFKTLKSVKSTFDSITGFFGELTNAVTDFNKRANLAARGSAFLMIAGGLLILAAALWVLSKIPVEDLLLGAGVLAVLGGIIIGFMWVMDKIDGGTIAKAGFGLGLLAAALFGFTGVLLILGLTPWDVLEQGMIVLGLMLGAITLAAVLLGIAAKDMPATAFGIMLLAGALTLLLIPLTELGNMDVAALEQGMLALGIALFGLVLATLLLSFGGPGMLFGAAALLVLVGALTLLVGPIQDLGNMDYETLKQGIIGLAATLGILVAAAIIMQPLMAGAVGLIAISAALVILSFGLEKLAGIDPTSAANGLATLAVALGLLGLAAGVATVFLPGVLGLAGLMLAFGIAAVMVGIASMLFAAGALILAGALPGLTTNLGAFLMLVPLFALATPFLIALGAGLLVFGVGALIAGVGAVVLGAGLLMLGIGMMLVRTHAEPASVALLAFVDAIMPLLLYIVQIGIIATALAALGAAMIILGLGMLLAGAGGVALGIGAIAAGVGIAILIGLVALVSPLIDRIVEAFAKLGPIAPGILDFGRACIIAATGLLLFYAQASRVVVEILKLIAAMRRLPMVFTTAATSASSAASALQLAMQIMVAAVIVGSISISMGVALILTTFTNLAMGITAVSPMIGLAVLMMMQGMGIQLTMGAVLVATLTAAILRAFTVFATKLTAQAIVIRIGTQIMVLGMTTELRKGVPMVTVSIMAISAAVGRLAPAISQNGSRVRIATMVVVMAVVSTLRGGVPLALGAGMAVGNAVAQGMVAGMRNGSSLVSAQARSMAQAALQAANTALGINSPSRESYAMIAWFIAGAINSFKDGTPKAESAAIYMADSIKGALNSSMMDIDMLDIRPTITPVLDLDVINRQTSGLNFGAGVDPSFNRGQASNLALLEEALSSTRQNANDGPTKEVKFEQNIHSPKALSEGEIYRHTKNLISQVERKEL